MRNLILGLVAASTLAVAASQPASAQVNVQIPGTGINVNFDPWNRGYYYEERSYYNTYPDSNYYYNTYPSSSSDMYYYNTYPSSTYYYTTTTPSYRYYNRYRVTPRARNYWVDRYGRIHYRR